MNRINVEECEIDDDLLIVDGLPFTGVVYSLYEAGALRKEEEVFLGLPHGAVREYYSSGVLKSCYMADGGRVSGPLVEFYETGQMKLREVHEYGVVLKTERWMPDGRLLETIELDPASNLFAYVLKCRGKDAERKTSDLNGA